MSSEDKYRLEIVKRTYDDEYAFAKKTLELVTEVDKNSIEKEIETNKMQYHVDHCWILKAEQKIGVVKVLKSSFYSFGLEPNLDNIEVIQILKLLIKDVSAWNNAKVEATLHSHYHDQALQVGFKVEFSRMKMRLELTNAHHLLNYESLQLYQYQPKFREELVKMFIDAYRGGVDERIGMFGAEVAHSAINSVIRGNFGKFDSDLSLVVKDDKSKIVAGVLTTISEGFPFIVIIGVTRTNQKRGIGRKILSWLVEMATKRNFEEIRLWVTRENTIARKLYESMGFEPLHQIHAFYL
jgi:ribosomal protein S18 acetylase RimI-like enzyme